MIAQIEGFFSKIVLSSGLVRDKMEILVPCLGYSLHEVLMPLLEKPNDI